MPGKKKRKKRRRAHCVEEVYAIVICGSFLCAEEVKTGGHEGN